MENCVILEMFSFTNNLAAKTMTENEKKVAKILTKEGIYLGPKYTYEIAKKIVESLCGKEIEEINKVVG